MKKTAPAQDTAPAAIPAETLAAMTAAADARGAVMREPLPAIGMNQVVLEVTFPHSALEDLDGQAPASALADILAMHESITTLSLRAHRAVDGITVIANLRISPSPPQSPAPSA